MGILINVGHGYTNCNAVENVIRYITRTRSCEQRASELVTWNAIGANCSNPESIISQFNAAAKLYCRSTGRKRGINLHHQVFRMDSEQNAFFRQYPECLPAYAYRLAAMYFEKGYQIVYAIHRDPKANNDYHIHFVINAFPYKFDQKFHMELHEFEWLELAFNREFDFWAWERRKMENVRYTV